MNVALALTIISADHSGLVARLAATIADHGGNWLESRMAHLGGQFAGILRIQVPVTQESELRAALQSLDGLSVNIYKDTVTAGDASPTLVTVAVVGHDRPGIVRQISQVFAQQRVNVEELTTHCESAPMSGESHFHATATVQLPASCSIHQLRHALEQIAADLMVDIAVSPERAV
jgi:glycine cleavage system regulatory protein